MSETRGRTYTMVFSNAIQTEPLGRAIVVPCKEQDLVEEAERLWAAERNCHKTNGRISGKWGCIAILTNPHRSMLEEHLRVWTDRVSEEPCYAKHFNSASGEDVVVDASGSLKITWPVSDVDYDSECDVLLATATNPTICEGRYASPLQVADAWNASDDGRHVCYFHMNRECGIRTFEDEDIVTRLESAS